MPKAVRKLVNCKKLIQIIKKFNPTYKTKYEWGSVREEIPKFSSGE